MGYSRKKREGGKGEDMEFLGSILKEKHVEIPGVNWKKVEFICQKSISSVAVRINKHTNLASNWLNQKYFQFSNLQ